MAHRQLIAELFPARELDELSGLARIEITGNRGRLFAFDALVIELIARALKNEELVPKRSSARPTSLDRKRSGESRKSFSARETLAGRKRRACFSPESPGAPAHNHRPAAIRFKPSITSSSAVLDLRRLSSDRGTVLCASTCL
jgi:hypothetical protein